jgi:ABC-2 type transport system ATP-binding protein
VKTRLELAAVTKSFGGRQVLNQAWLQVRSGEVVGLVGRNGAGKTTLLRIAAGLVRPDSGCVRWDGVEPSIRYFGGEATLPSSVSGRRWASLFAVAIDEKRRIGDLSRGTRQMLGLRVVLSTCDADVLLLDEPWEGLDPEGSDWLIERVREWQATDAAILISSHRLHELESVCSRLLMLRDGRLQGVLRRDARRAGVP